MLFQSAEFAVLLGAVLLGIILLRTQTLQLGLLVLGSWVFYAFWEPIFLLLLLYCTVNDYLLGLAIGRARTQISRKAWLIVSLITNLGVLAFFKYCNFFIDSVNGVLVALGQDAALPVLNVALPVGISFFTFHSMGYNIDVYRGKTPPEPSFLRFALYVAFFPQLVAGPILRAGQFLPQLHQTITLRADNLRSGAHLFLVGLVKKAIIADNVAPLVNAVFADPQGMPSLSIWLATLCFGLQIYCDFSGYTDMARGTSRMLNLEIPINFNYPYLATSITEFWKRWHISLSSWLRDYLYVSLGGNRYGAWNTYRNLMITMALGGLWHGASWNFVLWGVYQGFWLVIERALGSRHRADGPDAAERRTAWPLVFLRWLVCQYLVFLGWILFRVQDLNDLGYCVRKYVLFDFDLGLAALGLGAVNPLLVLLASAAFAGLHLYSARVGGIANLLDRMSPWRRRAVYLAAVFALIFLWPQTQQAFIYFQF